jgi:hypothetical protein
VLIWLSSSSTPARMLAAFDALGTSLPTYII